MPFTATTCKKEYLMKRTHIGNTLRVTVFAGIAFILTGCGGSDSRDNVPTISDLPTDIIVVAETASNVDLSDATFSDVDSGTDAITLKLEVDNGTLNAASTVSIIASGTGTTTLTLYGSAIDIDDYLNIASNIQYTGAIGALGNNAAALTLTANDGDGIDVVIGTVNIDIDGLNNDAPIVDNIDGDSVTFQIGSGRVNIDQNGDALVFDIDSADFNGGFLAVTQFVGTFNGTFSVDGTNVTSGGDAAIAAGETVAVSGVAIGTIDGTNDGNVGNSLRINFNENATPASVSTLLQNLTFSALSGQDNRLFQLTVNDNDGDTENSTAVNFTIVVN